MAYKVRYGSVTAAITQADLERAPDSLMSAILLPLDPVVAEVLTIPSAVRPGDVTDLPGWRDGSEDLFKVRISSTVYNNRHTHEPALPW